MQRHLLLRVSTISNPNANTGLRNSVCVFLFFLFSLGDETTKTVDLFNGLTRHPQALHKHQQNSKSNANTAQPLTQPFLIFFIFKSAMRRQRQSTCTTARHSPFVTSSCAPETTTTKLSFEYNHRPPAYVTLSCSSFFNLQLAIK